MEKIGGVVLTRVLDSDLENASWRAYDTGKGKIAIVHGIEVAGNLIAGPGTKDEVKLEIAARSIRGELGDVEVTYSVEATDDQCGPGYHLCDCLSRKFCCPDGMMCMCNSPYCL